MNSRREWLFDGLLGGLVGGVIGAIVAVNLVIFSGMERGYQSTIPEVFGQNWRAGMVTVTILAAGRMMRRRRHRAAPVTRPPARVGPST